jgi:molybdopterin-containing oxidoreductase family membrane subunit
MRGTMVGPAPSYRYWSGIALLGLLVAAGFYCYLQQLRYGLGVTGLGRDVSWGLYIAQFAIAEGFAASAVIVLLPGYLHGAPAFERIALPGVLVAIASITMCMLFILVDLGQPARVFNVLLHPTPTSVMFWDMVSLGGYLAINVVIALALLDARRTALAPPPWLRPLVLLSIPWGFAVHTVSAFLLGGLAARPLWFTTILAPRFLASAFASSAGLLLLLCLVLRRLAGFDAGAATVRTLGRIMAYALGCSLFFLLIEVLATLLGRVPEQMDALTFQYLGLGGRAPLVPLMWLSAALLLAALLLLLAPRLRAREALLALAALLVLGGLGLDKGYSFVVGGFVPTPLGAIPAYAPTLPEWGIVAGIWGVGALIVLLCHRVALAARPGS